jgi:uncharacterized lipoprotein YajG
MAARASCIRQKMSCVLFSAISLGSWEGFASLRLFITTLLNQFMPAMRSLIALFAVFLLTAGCSETSVEDKEIANFDQTANPLLGISGCERQVKHFIPIEIPAEKLSTSHVHDACYTARFRMPGQEKDGQVFASVDADGHLITLAVSPNLEKQLDGAGAEVISEEYWEQLDQQGCKTRKRTPQRVFCMAQAAADVLHGHLEERRQGGGEAQASLR